MHLLELVIYCVVLFLVYYTYFIIAHGVVLIYF